MRIALSFLTRFPVGRLTSDDYLRDLGRSAGLFPVVGLLVGLVSLGAYLPGRLLFGPAAAAAFATAAGLWITGALHLDGLMDTADGVLSARSRERMLEIMKDSRVGVMGVAAGALALLMRFALLLDMAPGRAAAALLVAPAVGRMAMPLAAAGWPVARAQEGIGSAYARHVGRAQVAAALLTGLGCALVLPLAVAMLPLSPGPAWTGLLLRGLAAWAAALGTCWGLSQWLVKHLGGLTGDTYGAMSEVAELAALACFGASVRGWTMW